MCTNFSVLKSIYKFVKFLSVLGKFVEINLLSLLEIIYIDRSLSHKLYVDVSCSFGCLNRITNFLCFNFYLYSSGSFHRVFFPFLLSFKLLSWYFQILNIPNSVYVAIISYVIVYHVFTQDPTLMISNSIS